MIYTLQRRVRVLREQVQRRDLHLELLRRKIALLEDAARTKAVLQTERDEAIHRARRSTKNAEKNFQQLLEVKAQLAEVKSQLSEAADFKITALERSRKIDELQARLHDLESEKCKLQGQISNYKTRARSAVESSNERRCRDEQVITVRNSSRATPGQIPPCHFYFISESPRGNDKDQDIPCGLQSPLVPASSLQELSGSSPAHERPSRS